MIRIFQLMLFFYCCIKVNKNVMLLITRNARVSEVHTQNIAAGNTWSPLERSRYKWDTIIYMCHMEILCEHIAKVVRCRAVFTHGPKGPGPRVANFQGRHIKKNRDWSMVCEKKKLSTREKFKRDLRKMKTLCFVFCQFFVLFLLTHNWIRTNGGSQNFLGPRGVKHLNTGLVRWDSMRKIYEPSCHVKGREFLDHNFFQDGPTQFTEFWNRWQMWLCSFLIM
jgi:hypothetical protein